MNLINSIVLVAFFIFWFTVYSNVFFNENELIISTDLRYPIKESFHYNTGIYTWLYSNDIFFFNIGYTPILTFIDLLSNIIDYYLIMKVLVTIPMLLSLINMYILASSINSYLRRNCKMMYILAIVTSLSYALNPISLLLFFNNTPISLGYAFLPLVLYIILTTLNKSITYKHILLSILVTTIMFIQFHNILFYLLIPLGVSLTICAIFKKTFKRIFILGIATTLVSSYAIIPLSYLAINGYFKDSTPIYYLDKDVLAFMFKDWSILNDLTLVSYPWDFKNIYYDTFSEQYFKLIGIASILAIIVGIIISPMDKNMMFLLLISSSLIISAIFLSLIGINLSLQISYGWIFRDVTKFLPLISFGLSLLILLINPTGKKIHIIAFVMIFAVITIAIMFKALPLLSINEYLHLYDNDRVVEVNKLLEAHKGKIAWLPIGPWERVYRDVLELSTPYPSMDVYSTLRYDNMMYLSKILVYDDIESYLDLVGVNYIGIDYNSNQKESLLLITEKLDKKFELIFDKDDIKIYKQDAEMIWIPYNIYSVKDVNSFLGKGLITKNVVTNKMIGNNSMITPKPNHTSLIIVNASNWMLSIWYNHNNTIANDIEYLTIIEGNNDYLKIGRKDQDIIIESKNSKIRYTEMFNFGWNNLIISFDNKTNIYMNDLIIFEDYLRLNNAYIYLDKTHLGYKGLITANLYLNDTSNNYLNAYIKEYTNIDPTKWKVKVNAKKPFLLCFSETYDRFWEARVYSNDRLINIKESIPINDIINGFWIDNTGELEIEIVYKPQEVFNIGIVISILSLPVSYLFTRINFN